MLAAKAGYDVEAQLRRTPRLREVPFDSQRKRMSVVVQDGAGQRVYAKGAASEILARSSLRPEDRAAIERVVDELAGDALRVLAFATRETRPQAGLGPDDLERDLVFLGLVGLLDPPRPEVTRAVAEAHTAGIAIVMVTGDYGLTAEAIARKIGIVEKPRPEILTGADLAGLDDDALRTRLAAVREGEEVLFARVAPADKLRVVTAFERLGEVVAVTGDGVNDAPALKRADIGVAMGVAGTDVAKEAAVMVLLDDSFATIVRAIERGRAVYNNIRRFLVYLFTHNIGELFPIVFATLAGLPVVPLNALQVLSIDLGSDVLPALALGAEEPEPGLLERPPRPRTERLMSRAVIGRFVFLGSIQAIGATVSFYFALYAGGWSWGDPLSTSDHVYHQAITMTQAAIVFSQVFNGLAVRTDRESVFKVGLFSNRALVAAEALGRGDHARDLLRPAASEPARHGGAAGPLLGRPRRLRNRGADRRGAAQGLRAPAAGEWLSDARDRPRMRPAGQQGRQHARRRRPRGHGDRSRGAHVRAAAPRVLGRARRRLRLRPPRARAGARWTGPTRSWRRRRATTATSSPRSWPSGASGCRS